MIVESNVFGAVGVWEIFGSVVFVSVRCGSGVCGPVFALDVFASVSFGSVLVSEILEGVSDSSGDFGTALFALFASCEAWTTLATAVCKLFMSSSISSMPA